MSYSKKWVCFSFSLLGHYWVTIVSDTDQSGSVDCAELAVTVACHVWRAFSVCNMDGNDVLQGAEVKRLMRLAGFPVNDALLTDLFSDFDGNNDGVIQILEFLPLMVQVTFGRALGGSKEEFDLYDVNADGVLDAHELAKRSGSQDDGVVESLQMDSNKDGQVDLQEFLAAADRKVTPRRTSKDEGACAEAN